MPNNAVRQTDPQTPCRNTFRRWLSLGVCVSVVAVIWLTILPALSRHPALQAEIRYRQARNINPDAMFYTELEMMDGVLERIDKFHRSHPSALWLPSRLEKTRPAVDRSKTPRN